MHRNKILTGCDATNHFQIDLNANRLKDLFTYTFTQILTLTNLTFYLKFAYTKLSAIAVKCSDILLSYRKNSSTLGKFYISWRLSNGNAIMSTALCLNSRCINQSALFAIQPISLGLFQRHLQV